MLFVVLLIMFGFESPLMDSRGSLMSQLTIIVDEDRLRTMNVFEA
jgi:hypothetical protein